MPRARLPSFIMASSLPSNIGLIIFFAAVNFFIYKVYNFVTLYFFVPSEPLKKYKRKNGTTWALISGSSGGIGYATAHRLLSHGFGVIIFAHEGVPEAETKLRKEYPDGKIKAFTFNCMTASTSDIEKLVNDVKDLPITILVNNVGGVPMAHPKLRAFVDHDEGGIDGQINLNDRFMTHLTRIMVSHLKANAAPRSLILSLSSGARMGIPYVSVYTATKAYNYALSTSLSREFTHLGYPIDVLAILPGEVLSDGNRAGMNNALLAHDFAGHIVNRVDEAVSRSMLALVPYWKHALQMEAMEYLPEGMLRRELAKIIEVKIEALDKEQ